MRTFKTSFTDNSGTDHAEFLSDGSQLYIRLRGINFEGDCFESLEGLIDKEKFTYRVYKDGSAELSEGRFLVEIPVLVQINDKYRRNILYADVQLSGENYGVFLKLEVYNYQSENTKRFGFFELTLQNLQKQLPKEVKLKTCLFCRFSEYNPFGNGMFGGLSCFKKVKEAYRNVQDKKTLLELFEKHKAEIFNVQETFDCEEHEFEYFSEQA